MARRKLFDLALIISSSLALVVALIALSQAAPATAATPVTVLYGVGASPDLEDISLAIGGPGLAQPPSLTTRGPRLQESPTLTMTKSANPDPVNAGELLSDTAGGTGTRADDFAVVTAPTITSFTPVEGPVGTAVTLTGTGFTGVTEVAFNGVSASFSVVSDSQIQATVPAGTTTGPISVTNAADTSTSTTDFTLTDTSWTSVDIGASTPGTTVESGSSVKAQESGADIWYSADGFRYVHDTATGDLELVAQVTAHQEGSFAQATFDPITTAADLQIAKSASKDRVESGTSFSYSIAVTNTGPSVATGIEVSDALPARLTFDTSGSSPGCSASGQDIICTIGALSISSGETLTIAVTVDTSLGNDVVLSNTASVSGNEPDPNPDDNSAPEEVIVERSKVFLPILLKPMPAELYVFNDDTGGDVTFVVLGTSVNCVVPDNTVQFCGTLLPGMYQVQVSSACGDGSATKTYGSGPVTTRIFCR